MAAHSAAGIGRSAVADPAFQVRPVHQPEHENDAVFEQYVAQDSVVANSQSMERVRRSVDGLDGTATNPARSRGLVGELVESLADARPKLGR
jgi:hypothetical protein